MASPIALFQQGFRLVSGDSLNVLIKAINAITGTSGSAGPVVASTLTAASATTGSLGIGGQVSYSYFGYTAAGSNSQSASQAILSTTPLAIISVCSAASRGVRLSNDAAATVGIIIQNETGTNCLVYPPTGGTINGGSANASITLNARKSGLFIESTPGNWYVLLGS